jgi:hypothetical protein
MTKMFNVIRQSTMSQLAMLSHAPAWTDAALLARFTFRQEAAK